MKCSFKYGRSGGHGSAILLFFQYTVCSNDSGPCWNILGNDRVRAHHRVIANGYGAKNHCASFNVHPVSYFGAGHHPALFADVFSEFQPLANFLFNLLDGPYGVAEDFS
jgi:hypothetical protein